MQGVSSFILISLLGPSLLCPDVLALVVHVLRLSLARGGQLGQAQLVILRPPAFSAHMVLHGY